MTRLIEDYREWVRVRNLKYYWKSQYEKALRIKRDSHRIKYTLKRLNQCNENLRKLNGVG